jgi:hypothetical protein
MRKSNTVATTIPVAAPERRTAALVLARKRLDLLTSAGSVGRCSSGGVLGWVVTALKPVDYRGS